MRKVVVNSTPIISLSTINKLDLLKSLYGEVYIPYGVFEEVSIEGKSKVGDDLLARKYATYLGLKITGTLGVLIKSKEKGIIREVKPLIDGLIKKGIYIDDKIYRKVLELTGEYK